MSDAKFLYHYTNIETLALILKNRTIRFNSLDKMDDLQEQQTADVKNIGQFCYISSWTDDATESIPMWNMYASLNLGVRIGLKSNPFRIYDYTANDLASIMNVPVTDEMDGKPIQTVIPFSDMLTNGFVPIQMTAAGLLNKVQYTNDPNKLYPHILEEDEKGFSLALGELGKCKNLHWTFQHEWRYILHILPFNLIQASPKVLSDVQLTANKMKEGLAKQPFPYYDMQLSDTAFDNMEITLSPRISAGSRIIVESLAEKYNNPATLKDSDLTGLI